MADMEGGMTLVKPGEYGLAMVSIQNILSEHTTVHFIQ